MRTKTHELRPNGNRENDKVEDLNHLKIGIRAVGNEDSADVEKKCLGQVDQATGNTVCATFDKSTSHAGPH